MINRKRQRQRRRKKLLLAGAGGAIAVTGAVGAALLYSRKQKSKIRSNQEGFVSTTTQGKPPSGSKKTQPLPKPTAAELRTRGFGRLTKQQRNNLENKYGYNFQTQRFGNNISKSSRRKGVKILRSVGRFKRGERLTAFAN